MYKYGNLFFLTEKMAGEWNYGEMMQEIALALYPSLTRTAAMRLTHNQ